MQNGAGALTAAHLKNVYLEVAAAPKDHFIDIQGHSLARPHSTELCEPPILHLGIKCSWLRHFSDSSTFVPDESR
jgi:hypothetical protein